MFDFYSATIFLSVFIMIIMDMLVSGNDLMEHDKKQTVYTISVLVIACMVSEWFGVWMDGAHPSLRTLHILVKTIELSTAPIITVLCSDLMTPLKHKKLIYTLIGVHAGLNCTPFVRQYGILLGNGVFFYAKGSTEQTIHSGIQKTGDRNHARR